MPTVKSHRAGVLLNVYEVSSGVSVMTDGIMAAVRGVALPNCSL